MHAYGSHTYLGHKRNKIAIARHKTDGGQKSRAPRPTDGRALCPGLLHPESLTRRQGLALHWLCGLQHRTRQLLRPAKCPRRQSPDRPRDAGPDPNTDPLWRSLALVQPTPTNQPHHDSSAGGREASPTPMVGSTPPRTSYPPSLTPLPTVPNYYHTAL